MSASLANTKIKNSPQGKRRTNAEDQPLDWHLQQVGDACCVYRHKNDDRFESCWFKVNKRMSLLSAFYFTQISVAKFGCSCLQKQINKMPDTPLLISLNIRRNGSGKTRMNLRAACILRPNDPRLAIALNLRSLTLQTGDALKSSMNLSDDEIAVIIGDHVSQKLFNESRANASVADGR